MPKTINTNETRLIKLRGKYFNDTINPKELKEFNALVMNQNNYVSLKEMGSRFRNHKDSLPGEDNTINNTGDLYDAFTN